MGEDPTSCRSQPGYAPLTRQVERPLGDALITPFLKHYSKTTGETVGVDEVASIQIDGVRIAFLSNPILDYLEVKFRRVRSKGGEWEDW